MGLHSTFLASPSSSYGDQDHDDADNNDVHAHIDDGDADISTFLARPHPHMVIRMLIKIYILTAVQCQFKVNSF